MKEAKENVLTSISNLARSTSWTQPWTATCALRGHNRLHRVVFASPILPYDMDIINLQVIRNGVSHIPGRILTATTDFPHHDAVRAPIIEEYLKRADAHIICAKLDDCL